MLWMLIASKAIDGDAKSIPYGRSGGAYFAEIGSVTWELFSSRIGEALFRMGLADTPDAEAWPSLEAAAEALQCPLSWAGTVYGANTNWIGRKAKVIGWNPKHDLNHFISSMEEEVRAVLEVDAVSLTCALT
jgi:hypothetical protein